MKNSIYPFLHWQTTLILTPFIYVIWLTYLEGAFGIGTISMFLFLWVYSFLFSLPIFGVYCGLFYLLLKTELTNFDIKLILNSFLFVIIYILFYIFFEKFDLVLIYTLTIILSSFFFRIRIQKKEETHENILKENT